MSYEPTNWKAGDTVTSAKLNKIEQGIKNSVLVANMTLDKSGIAHLDKTWQEVYDADFCAVNSIMQDGIIGTSFIVGKLPANEENRSDYEIILFSPGVEQQLVLRAETPDDYPSSIEQIESDGPVIIK